MSRFLRYCLGADIAKADFKVCLSGMEAITLKYKVVASSTFNNTPKGFSSLLLWLKKHCKDQQAPFNFVMEATGVYYEPLALFLHGQGLQLSVVLPTKAKHYLKSPGYKSKTDKIDAQGLSLMGLQQDLPVHKPVSQALYQLRALCRYHHDLQKQRTRLNNQLHALQWGMYPVKSLIGQLGKEVERIKIQLQELEKEISMTVIQDSFLREKWEKIGPIRGVGMLTFATVVAETGGFALVENQRQLTSYAGYDVVSNESGKFKGRTRISKKGNSNIRRILHMSALGVVKWQEPVLCGLYKRVYERTGVKMKAYVAVQRKLLLLIYTLWKKDEAYEAGHGQPKSEEKANSPASPDLPGDTVQGEAEGIFDMHEHEALFGGKACEGVYEAEKAGESNLSNGTVKGRKDAVEKGKTKEKKAASTKEAAQDEHSLMLSHEGPLWGNAKVKNIEKII